MDDKLFFQQNPFSIIIDYHAIIKNNDSFWKDAILYFYKDHFEDGYLSIDDVLKKDNLKLQYAQLVDQSCRGCYITGEKIKRHLMLDDAYLLCFHCKQTDDRYNMITYSIAKTYGLNRDELDEIESVDVENPHCSYSDMTLYMKKDVLKLCSEKYGSHELYLKMSNGEKNRATAHFESRKRIIEPNNEDSVDSIRHQNILQFPKVYNKIVEQDNRELKKFMNNVLTAEFKKRKVDIDTITKSKHYYNFLSRHASRDFDCDEKNRAITLMINKSLR